MGYWDRSGLPDFYTGPTGGGLAPLNAAGANVNIRSMWATKAGLDGRPANKPGHTDDYYVDYEITGPDPYVTAGRPEHAADCIGDFIGLSQRKYSNMNGECDGNIDAYSFNYWQTDGQRRVNFTNAVDIQSGLKAWAKYRGYDADVFSQLVEFNPHVPPGTGFTWANLKAEIDAGYPVLLFLQPSNQTYRLISGTTTRVNPEIHGVLAYGYEEDLAFGIQFVYIRTSWGSGDGVYQSWDAGPWLNLFPPLHVRGVIGFHPLPRIRSVTRSGGNITFNWDGPSSLVRTVSGDRSVHSYQLERSPTLQPANFVSVGSKTTARTMTVPDPGGAMGFYRLRLIAP